MLKASDFVTLHVPLVEKTRHLVNAKNLELHAATGAVLLNFSRDGVVEDEAVLQGARQRASCKLVRHRLSRAASCSARRA